MQRLTPRALWVAASLLPVALSAHNFPISYGILSISHGQARLRLRLSVHNLHPALEAFTGHRMEMKDEGYDLRLLDAYLKHRLELVSPKGKAVPFKVVGQEIGIEEIVFTLEAALENPKGWKIRDEVLFEQSQDQKNYLTVEAGAQRTGLTFDAQHPLLPLLPSSAP